MDFSVHYFDFKSMEVIYFALNTVVLLLELMYVSSNNKQVLFLRSYVVAFDSDLLTTIIVFYLLGATFDCELFRYQEVK